MIIIQNCSLKLVTHPPAESLAELVRQCITRSLGVDKKKKEVSSFLRYPHVAPIDARFNSAILAGGGESALRVVLWFSLV